MLTRMCRRKGKCYKWLPFPSAKYSYSHRRAVTMCRHPCLAESLTEASIEAGICIGPGSAYSIVYKALSFTLPGRSIGWDTWIFLKIKNRLENDGNHWTNTSLNNVLIGSLMELTTCFWTRFLSLVFNCMPMTLNTTPPLSGFGLCLGFYCI